MSHPKRNSEKHMKISSKNFHASSNTILEKNYSDFNVFKNATKHEKKIKYNKNIYIKDLLKIPLIPNSKKPYPRVRFATNSEKKKYSKKHVDDDGTNWGTLTGKFNHITVVDLDFYTKGDKIYDEKKCIFVKKFGKESEFIDYFNTATVKTPNGGIHLYFLYDPEIPQTSNSKHKIDIRNNGGYVVSPMSTFEEKKYVTIKDVRVKTIPDDLKEFLLLHLYDNHDKTKKKKLKSNDKIELQNVSYNISCDEWDNVINKLPLEYWIDCSKWIIFTTACKILGYKGLWDKINKNKPNYNIDENNIIWDSVDKSYTNTIDKILIDSNNKMMINYCKYKAVVVNTVKPDKIINNKHMGHDFFDNKHNFVCKSDTGTGKTTSFMHYAKKTKCLFISIVPRISLGEDQYIKFVEHGLDVYFYKHTKKYKEGDNVCIQLDSIISLATIKSFEKYVIYLDEFNSLIEHLVMSPTLSKNRVSVWKLLITIISECKQFICTDADMSDVCFEFLKLTKREHIFVQNKYIHNKDIKTQEIHNYEIFCNKLRNESKYIVCCDSAIEAKRLFDRLVKYDDKIILLTANNNKNSNNAGYYDGSSFDNHNKIIFSPAVVYGIDSIMKRPVYCLYKEGTIMPSAMLQQINRDRNITILYYLFTKKKYVESSKTYDDIKREILDSNGYGQSYFKLSSDNDMCIGYMNILSMLEYRNDCYNTNKFAYFNMILDIRGFNRKTEYSKTTFVRLSKQEKLEIRRKNIDKFDKNNLYVQKINKILKIPENKLDDYKSIFVDEYQLEQHFKICNLFFKEKDEIIDSFDNLNDFKVNIMRSDKAKILFIHKIREKCGIIDKKDIIVKKCIDRDEQDILFEEYENIFRHQGNQKRFDSIYDIQQYLVRMYKQVAGINIINRKRPMINNKRSLQYEINMDIVNYNEKIYNYWKPKLIVRLF